MGLKVEHQPGVLSRGLALAALLAIAVVVAVSMAAGLVDQVRSLGATPGGQQGPAAAAAYDPQ